MTLPRRDFLKLSGLAAIATSIEPWSKSMAQTSSAPEAKADYTLRIATGLVELAPEHIVSTTLYNGQFPGPLLRFKEGQRAVVDIYNDTDTPELVHWHGQMIPSDVDGASEEGTPFVPAHGMRRVSFVPKPSGFRFYHTHVLAGGDLNRGTYTGQAGPVYIEPKNNPGAYDREIFLVMKEFEPSFSRGGDMAMDFLAGEPIKELQQIDTLHQGRRYRLKFRNASDDIHPLHLHRHSFELTNIGGKPTSGVLKDVVMLGGFQELEFDFVADNPGATLFHCHQQLHMDFGFMALFKYA